jgi:WD40 repeat protein
VEVTAVCFALNNIIISANLDKVIILTDSKELEILKKFEGHADPIIALASSPDGK